MTSTDTRIPLDWRVVVIGLAGGGIAGFFGVGGGIVLVPLIMLFLSPPRHVAHATSLGAIIALSFSGMVGFAIGGEVDWAVGIAVGIGGVIGASIGATLLNRLSASTLRTIFAVVLLVAGLRMTF